MHLFLGQLRLLFHALLLGLKRLQLPLVVYIFLLKLINFSGSLTQSLFLDLQDLLKTLVLLFFFFELDAGLMPHFVCQVEFLSGVIKVIFSLFVLLHDLGMGDFQRLMLNLFLLEVNLEAIKLFFELFDSFLPLPRQLIMADHLLSDLLIFFLDVLELLYELIAFLLV